MVFQESVKGAYSLKVCQGSFKGVSTVLEGRFKEVSRVFQASVEGISRKFQGDFKEGCFEGVFSGF